MHRDGPRRIEEGVLHGGAGQSDSRCYFELGGPDAAAMERGEVLRRGRIPGFEKCVHKAAEIARCRAMPCIFNTDDLKWDLIRFWRQARFAGENCLDSGLAGCGDEGRAVDSPLIPRGQSGFLLGLCAREHFAAMEPRHRVIGRRKEFRVEPKNAIAGGSPMQSRTNRYSVLVLGWKVEHGRPACHFQVGIRFRRCPLASLWIKGAI